MDTTPEITLHDLKVLSIGYYIQGGIVGCYTLFALAYMALIGFLFSSTRNLRNGPDGMPPALIPILAIVFGIVIFLCVACTVCTLLAGYWLAHRRHRVFLLVVGALSCLAIPYGTVLGVFTFIVLGRPTAQKLFAEAFPPAA
jgi:hypothetical protein